MQLAIVQNPHLAEDDERRAIWDMLDGQLEGTTEEKTVEAEIRPDDFDPNEMERLKFALSGNPRIIVK